LGDSFFGSRDVKMHVSVPLHCWRCGGCSTKRILYKILWFKMFSLWM